MPKYWHPLEVASSNSTCMLARTSAIWRIGSFALAPNRQCGTLSPCARSSSRCILGTGRRAASSRRRNAGRELDHYKPSLGGATSPYVPPDLGRFHGQLRWSPRPWRWCRYCKWWGCDVGLAGGDGAGKTNWHFTGALTADGMIHGTLSHGVRHDKFVARRPELS
jgi:hypothetical protein